MGSSRPSNYRVPPPPQPKVSRLATPSQFKKFNTFLTKENTLDTTKTFWQFDLRHLDFDCLRKNEDAYLFIVESDDNIIGYCHCYMRHPTLVDILLVYMGVNNRGTNGLCNHLVKGAIDAVLKDHMKIDTIYVNPTSFAAFQCYVAAINKTIFPICLVQTTNESTAAKATCDTISDANYKKHVRTSLTFTRSGISPSKESETLSKFMCGLNMFPVNQNKVTPI